MTTALLNKLTAPFSTSPAWLIRIYGENPDVRAVLMKEEYWRRRLQIDYGMTAVNQSPYKLYIQLLRAGPSANLALVKTPESWKLLIKRGASVLTKTGGDALAEIIKTNPNSDSIIAVIPPAQYAAYKRLQARPIIVQPAALEGVRGMVVQSTVHPAAPAPIVSFFSLKQAANTSNDLIVKWSAPSKPVSRQLDDTVRLAMLKKPVDHRTLISNLKSIPMLFALGFRGLKDTQYKDPNGEIRTTVDTTVAKELKQFEGLQKEWVEYVWNKAIKNKDLLKDDNIAYPLFVSQYLRVAPKVLDKFGYRLILRQDNQSTVSTPSGIQFVVTGEPGLRVSRELQKRMF